MIVAAAGWAGAALALTSALLLTVQGFRAQRRPGTVPRGQLAFPVYGIVLGAAVAMGALEVALLTDDFSVAYVAETHALATPLFFTITSAWSALAGSLVLWALVLAGYIAVVLRQVRDTSDRLGSGALGVLGLVAVFFFGMVVSVANPFRVLSNPPADGPGPNPILADHVMVAFHPPLLYLGFVGFTVPFAFAISALLCRQAGTGWLRRTRRANLVAWTFLTGGLVLGAWWSYEVLGWGGYWAWDPVENAALIPWLVATAFVHSSVVQVKRGLLQSWNFVLVIATFALTILGTFLTRSSVVTSVHSFTQSPVGPALLGFLLVVLGGGFGLFVLRGQQLATGSRLESVASREGVFLLNNLLLSLFAFVVLLGTLYPVFVEAFTGDQVSVGRPFFDRMAVPLAFALLVAMGIGPFTSYRQATAAVLWRRTRIPLLVGAATAAGLVVAGVRSAGVVAAAGLAAGIATASLRQLTVSAWRLEPRTIWRLLRKQRGYWGGQLAHFGLALVVLAIAVSGGLATRSTLELTKGRPVSFAGYSVTYEGSQQHRQPDRLVTAARIVFRQDGNIVNVFEPQLSAFRNQAQAVAQPDVRSGWSGDLYVALTELEPERAGVSLYRYPFMWLLWFGGIVTAAGGAWALLGRRGARRAPGTTASTSPEPERAEVSANA